MRTKFSTVIEFANEMNYDSCLSRYRGMRLRDVQKENFVKLRELKQIYSEDGVIAFLQAWVITLSEFFNLKDDRGKISGRQSEEIAMNILDDFSFLNLPELTILFRNIRKGRYFDIYGRISGVEIYKAVQEFAQERASILVKLKEEKHKEQGGNIPLHERANFIKQLLKNRQNGKEEQNYGNRK